MGICEYPIIPVHTCISLYKLNILQNYLEVSINNGNLGKQGEYFNNEIVVTYVSRSFS